MKSNQILKGKEEAVIKKIHLEISSWSDEEITSNEHHQKAKKLTIPYRLIDCANLVQLVVANQRKMTGQKSFFVSWIIWYCYCNSAVFARICPTRAWQIYRQYLWNFYCSIVLILPQFAYTKISLFSKYMAYLIQYVS